MTVIEPIQDLDDQTFNPYLADELIYGDIADPYRSAIDGLLARGPPCPALMPRSTTISGE